MQGGGLENSRPGSWSPTPTGAWGPSLQGNSTGCSVQGPELRPEHLQPVWLLQIGAESGAQDSRAGGGEEEGQTEAEPQPLSGGRPERHTRGCWLTVSPGLKSN